MSTEGCYIHFFDRIARFYVRPVNERAKRNTFNMYNDGYCVLVSSRTHYKRTLKFNTKDSYEINPQFWSWLSRNLTTCDHKKCPTKWSNFLIIPYPVLSDKPVCTSQIPQTVDQHENQASNMAAKRCQSVLIENPNYLPKDEAKWENNATIPYLGASCSILSNLWILSSLRVVRLGGFTFLLRFFLSGSLPWRRAPLSSPFNTR